MILLAGLLVIVLAIVATSRRVDVRLVLIMAALALGTLAGLGKLFTHSGDASEMALAFVSAPMVIVQTFLATLVAEKFVVPICCAMDFAHVLRLTQCDQHLVHLLVRPLRRVKPLLIPGAVLVGFLVNIPVISQASTAVCVGSVLVPILLAARVSPETAGAALLLGCSLGGELLNPGAPELGTIADLIGLDRTEIVARILPLVSIQLAIAGAIFWFTSLRYESSLERAPTFNDAPWVTPAASADAPPNNRPDNEIDFRINYIKALVPVMPVVFLFLAGPPLNLVKVPAEWLVTPQTAGFYSSRLVGAAMLVGTAMAVLTTPSAASAAAQTFFEGAGYAFTNIIAVIVTATCFGKGIELIGLATLLGEVIVMAPNLLVPAAGALPMSFAFLSGSGMASTQSLFRFFGEPAMELGLDAARVGAVVSIASAAGRTMSPVAVVVFMCATLSGTDPFAVVKRVALPLLISTAVMVAVATVMVG